MESNELRFKRIGLSSDGAVIFCEMDNGKTYAMPLVALASTPSARCATGRTTGSSNSSGSLPT